MKKLNLKLLMVAVAIMSVMSAEAKLISVGPSAALSSANFSVKDDAAAIANHMGYQFGVDVAIKIPLLSVAPGIYYNRNTFTSCSDMTSYVSCDVVASSITVPVIFGLSLFGPLTIEAGPVFTIKEYNTMESTLAGITVSGDLGELRKKDSYLVGVRATFFGLTAYARYNQQFGTSTTTLGEVRYSGYSVGLGFRF